MNSTNFTFRGPLLAVLLSSTAVFAVAALPADAAPSQRAFMVAQGGAPADPVDPKHAKDKAEKDKAEHDKAEADKKKADHGKPPAPPAAVQVKPPQAPPPPAAQAKPPEAPPAVAQAKPPEAPPAAAQAKPHGADEKRPQNRDAGHDRKAPAAPAAAAAPEKPAAPTAAKPADKAPAPAAAAPAPQAPAAQAPAAQNRQAAPTAPARAGGPPAQAPAAAAAPAAPPAAPVAAAPPPPTKPHDAAQFIRRDGQQQSRGMDDVRKERRETKDGNRVVIHEGDRTIEREGQRTIIRHNEADRFSVGARDVKVERRGSDTVSIIVRPNGISIVSTTDGDGHLLRRVRRDRDGREVVIIDNGFAGARRGDYFVDLAPPRIQLPRDRYIVDAGHANRDQLYAIFTAQPVEHIERRYTLDEVRYSDPLRARMPRVDLDVNFDTGSWQLTPDQVASLSAIAQGLNRAIEKNPREVFLIEGHTDAVGSADDNLSLSDRRAEAVAVALTEQFQVPPENLVTQGYGEEYLKVATDGPARENRRVAVRRITPLIDQAQTTGGNR
jgi:outer membrane protein OmpA-like peptidoglycan-associated protein